MYSHPLYFRFSLSRVGCSAPAWHDRAAAHRQRWENYRKYGWSEDGTTKLRIADDFSTFEAWPSLILIEPAAIKFSYLKKQSSPNWTRWGICFISLCFMTRFLSSLFIKKQGIISPQNSCHCVSSEQKTQQCFGTDFNPLCIKERKLHFWMVPPVLEIRFKLASFK